ncbi:MAG: hypothetical protein ABR552_10590 [Actinomycetota bacterium]
MEDVRLPDLEVIRRYSIAVRREHAPADEVIEALRHDLERLVGRARPARAAAVPSRRATTPVRRAAPARKPASKRRR